MSFDLTIILKYKEQDVKKWVGDGVKKKDHLLKA